MYVSRTFTKAKKSAICAEYPMGSKFHLSKWKTYFSQFIEKFLKIEEVEYLIHYVKFKMCPALFYVNSQHFWMLVLGCTLFPPIYREIENWDFECCSKLLFFPQWKSSKSRLVPAWWSVYAVYSFVSYARRKSLGFISSKQRIFWCWILSFSVCQQIHKKNLPTGKMNC